MSVLVLAIVVLAVSGMASLLAARSPRLAAAVGVAGAVSGSLLGLFAAGRFIVLGRASESLVAPWAVPGGSFALRLDALSAVFLVPTFLLGALCALYGHEYLAANAMAPRSGRAWLFYNILLGSIAVVFVAGNAVLFLVSWELMAVSSFFLVTLEDEEEQVRQAGWTYLVASHLGTAFLIALFAVLAARAGSLDFSAFEAVAGDGGVRAGLFFALALVGFGVKAGLMPLHVWLPEAHPAAPSHVSALMSGVMIKTGVYGIVRTLGFLGPAAPWWGFVLIGAGALSGLGGVIFALAQHDLKRLLAYHSVENVGIITMGLGVGVLGASSGSPALAALGFAGALLHVVNHAIFKGLLFLGAGAVLTTTGTRNIERLGGLMRLLPWTGVTFLVGAAAISGLPPFNGFVSEFLILIGAMKGVATLPAGGAVPLLVVVAAIALIGGLAAACFAKAFGIVFLGTPRASLPDRVADPGMPMKAPLVLLAAACPAIGFLSPWLVPRLGASVGAILGGSEAGRGGTLEGAGTWLTGFAACAALLLAAALMLALLRNRLLAARDVRMAATWGCGYAAPTARMQYTASSFADPLTRLFQPVLRTHGRTALPPGLFPAEASFHTETPDAARRHLYAPLFEAAQRAAARARGIQHGRLQLYVLYVALTLLALLFWELGWNR